MIHRGRRQADRFHGDLHVVYVEQHQSSAADEKMLEQNLAWAREAKAHVEILRAADPIRAILEFAAKHGITQIFVGHGQEAGWMSRLKTNPVERLILGADGIDVRIFPRP
jgi:K+-sensing histidine kinase KdpD